MNSRTKINQQYQQVNECTQSIEARSESEACEHATMLRLSKLGGYLGDQARARLVQQNYPWILNHCRNTLRNEADAADAAQDAALAMYRALPGFEGRSALRTWLHRIAQNACVSLIRKRQRHVMANHIESLLEIHLQQCLSSSSDNSDAVLDVRQVLAGMPEKNREVLQLRFFSELSLDDISSTLGISLSAAKMRLYRAMEQFRDQHAKLAV